MFCFSVLSNNKDDTPLSALRDLNLAPRDRVRPRTHRDYVNAWTDIPCSCGQIAGQIKYDEGPGGGRDPPTWFFRCRLSSGQWPSKGPFFRRRSTTTVGNTDEFAVGWIKEHCHCCGANRDGS